MFGTRSDLALRRDDASRFLPWILALQVYFAVVALADLPDYVAPVAAPAAVAS